MSAKNARCRFRVTGSSYWSDSYPANDEDNRSVQSLVVEPLEECPLPIRLVQLAFEYPYSGKYEDHPGCKEFTRFRQIASGEVIIVEYRHPDNLREADRAQVVSLANERPKRGNGWGGTFWDVTKKKGERLDSVKWIRMFRVIIESTGEEIVLNNIDPDPETLPSPRSYYS